MEDRSATELPGLRERKKRQVRHAIRAAAWKLFQEHGYDAVSVEQIAAAADVSRTTFFNYFPTKDAVVTEPDEQMLSTQSRLCQERPEDELLWDSLTAVLLGIMTAHPEAIAAHTQLKATSPATADLLHRATEQMLSRIRVWVLDRGAASGRQDALLQMNVAIAAVMTALEQWHSPEFDDLLDAARANLRELDGAFAARPD